MKTASSPCHIRRRALQRHSHSCKSYPNQPPEAQRSDAIRDRKWREKTHLRKFMPMEVCWFMCAAAQIGVRTL